MSLTVSCACGLKYKVREDNRGKSIRCRECGARIAIPEAEAAADDERGDGDEADVQLSRPGASRGSKKRRASSSAQPFGNKTLFIVIGAAGLAGLFAIGLVVVLVLALGRGKPAGVSADGKRDSDGNAQVNERSGQHKLTGLPEKYTILVAEATPAKGPSAMSLLASSRPAQDWSVELGGIKLPEKLGSAWYVPAEAQPEGLTTPSLLTTGGTRAALLFVPHANKPAKLFEIDLAKPGAATKGIDLPPPEGPLPQLPISIAEPHQIWLGSVPPQNEGKLRPRDRWRHVAAINSSLTKVANGLYSSQRMQVWDGTGKRLASIQAPDRSHWVFADFLSDDLLCLIDTNGAARLVEPAGGKVVHEAEFGWRGSAATTPDRRYIVGCSGSAIEFRDGRTLKLAGSLPLPDDLAKSAKLVGPSLDVSTDGRRLAAFFVAGEDFVLLAWDLTARKLTDAYVRKAYGANVWVQWVGERRVVIAGDSQVDFSVLDLDLRAVIYTTGSFVITAPSVDGRMWRFTDRRSTDWLRKLHDKVRGTSSERELPPLLLAGAAVPDRVESFAANLTGLPVNRNLPVRVEVAGREHWPLKQTLSGFVEYLSKNGFTIDPNAKTVYRLVLDYKSVSINRSGMVGPMVSGEPGVAFVAELDLGPDARQFPVTIYRGMETFTNSRSLAPKGITVEEWESKYPDATKAAQKGFLNSIQTLMENNSAGLKGVGSSSDQESYYVMEGNFAVPRPFEGDFPVDGYDKP